MKVMKEKEGRVNIPVELLKEMEISKGQEVNVSIKYGKICIKKFKSEKLKKYKHIGVLTKIDSHNRVYIPKKYWLLFNINNTEVVDLQLKGKTIIITI